MGNGKAGALYRTIVFDVFQVADVTHFHSPKGITSTVIEDTIERTR